MQKKIKWVFFAFTLILATMLPSTVQASTMSYDDLPQFVKDKYSPSDKFAYGKAGTYRFITTSNAYKDINDKEKISGTKYTDSWVAVSDTPLLEKVTIYYSTYDIKNADGTVFFSKTMEPIPKALTQVLPNLLSQAKRILPVGLVVLSALLVVSLIPKVLYRLF